MRRKALAEKAALAEKRRLEMVCVSSVSSSLLLLLLLFVLGRRRSDAQQKKAAKQKSRPAGEESSAPPEQDGRNVMDNMIKNLRSGRAFIPKGPVGGTQGDVANEAMAALSRLKKRPAPGGPPAEPPK